MINSFPSSYNSIKKELLEQVNIAKAEFEDFQNSKMNIITEHFGRADTSVEICELSSGNTITVIHKDGEAKIFPSIYEMVCYETGHRENVERFYCDEEQLEFIYENFTDYQDIVANFDVENTKRK